MTIQQVYAERVRHAKELAVFGDLEGALRLVDREDKAMRVELTRLAPAGSYRPLIQSYDEFMATKF